MIVWRIANKKFKTLSGVGGLYAGGRWHKQGSPVVYTAEHPALSAMEVLVHMNMDMDDLPDYVLLEILIPDDLSMETFDVDPSDTQTCLEHGISWLSRGKDAIAKAPSVLMPKSYNYLLNPQHEHASRIAIQGEQPFVFDGRLTPATGSLD